MIPVGSRGRYVILVHDHPVLHWDFMLEYGGTLKTWSLSTPPKLGDLVGEILPDHRLAYLDYEGPVSGNRGTVHRWDQGVYHIETGGIWLEGEKLQGLVRISEPSH